MLKCAGSMEYSEAIMSSGLAGRRVEQDYARQRAAAYRDRGLGAPATRLAVDEPVADGASDECPFVIRPSEGTTDQTDAAPSPPDFTPVAAAPHTEPVLLNDDEAAAQNHLPAEPSPAPSTTPPMRRRPARPRHSEAFEVPPPARWGWRGVFNRIVPGVRINAGPQEAQWHRDRGVIRRASWTDTRQIAVVGLEGGAMRTTAALLIALALGDARRGQVLAWDGTRGGGPLTQRGEGGGQGLGTLRDGLAPVDTVARMSALVSRQVSPCDVLGWPSGAADRPLDVPTAEAIAATAARHYSLTIVDTGADRWDDLWQHIVRTSDAFLVVHTPTTHGAQSAQRTLAALEAHGRDPLECVAVSFGGQPPADPEQTLEWLALTRDPALWRPGPLRWDDLTRDLRCTTTSAARRLVQVLTP